MTGVSNSNTPTASSKKRPAPDSSPSSPVATTSPVSHKKQCIAVSPTPATTITTSSISTSNNETESTAYKWKKSIEKAIKSIVSIRFSQVATFDTESSDVSEATGFCVDAKRGIILTNRHVVGSGPFEGDAVFSNHEEVDCIAIYRDPIHDFGFLKFNPEKVQYLQLDEIPLKPENCAIGVEVKVVGNDAGERLSILTGSISRLNRNTPDYGELTFNDFNSFYIQCAASTSGGSSGSPVLDITGSAVALQAGGRVAAATDFFFPLHRVKRALKYIQDGLPVPRGTIQTQFLHRPYDEVRRLGLQSSTERTVRSLYPDEIGMLAVEVVLPKGPAHNMLEEGDVLISINDKIVTGFIDLEEMMDSNIGKTLKVKVERGGAEMVLDIPVQNLHDITPDRYVEIGGAKLNNLSYQLARQFCVPVEGVFIAEPTGMFRLTGNMEKGYMIKAIDGKSVSNLDEFIQVMKGIPDKERIPITYYSIADVHTINVAIVLVDKHWGPFRLAVRNDTTGFWDFTTIEETVPPLPLVPKSATFPVLDDSLGVAKKIFKSIVKVSFTTPAKVDGFPKSRKAGSGLILDKEKGIVVVGRNLVPFAIGDVYLTFADSIIIPAKVVYLHPTHNVTFLSYDPKLIGTTPVEAATISKKPLAQGHRVWLAALNTNQRAVGLVTTVTDIQTVSVPVCLAPRFRSVNFDGITVDTPLAQHCSSGVLADDDGAVQALWLSFLGETNHNGHDVEYHMGIKIEVVLEVLVKLQGKKSPMLRGLLAEYTPVQIWQARTGMGLSDEWVAKVEKANPSRPQVFMVRRVEGLSSTAEMLKEGDIVLSVNGKVVSQIRDVDVRVQEAWGKTLELVVLRDKEELKLQVPTVDTDGEGTDKIVFWAGALIQSPHKAVMQQSKKIPSKVYISARSKGSPAFQYDLQPTNFIVAVNDKQTDTLEDFVAAVKGLPDNEYVRVKCISFDQVPTVLTVKLCNHYFPLAEMVRDKSVECGWKKVVHEE